MIQYQNDNVRKRVSFAIYMRRGGLTYFWSELSSANENAAYETEINYSTNQLSRPGSMFGSVFLVILTNPFHHDEIYRISVFYSRYQLNGNVAHLKWKKNMTGTTLLRNVDQTVSHPHISITYNNRCFDLVMGFFPSNDVYSFNSHDINVITCYPR